MKKIAGGKLGVYAGLRKQRGAYAIEVTLALTLSMMAAIVYWQDKADENRAIGLKAASQQLVELNNSVQTYLSQGYSKILYGQPISKPTGGTVANIFSPTIQELKELGYLTPTFSTTPTYGAGYQITLSKVPASCTVPNCDVQSVVNFTQPIYKPGTTAPDEAGAGLVVQQIGANGGRTTATTPTIITGLGAGWTLTSPVAQAGIVAIRGGYNSSAYGVFFRTDGTSVMGGNANMGGNDVYNVKDLTSTGTVTANAATVSGLLSAGSVHAATGQFTGTLTANTLTTAGNATVGGDVVATGKVKGQKLEGGKILINDVVVEGGTCTGSNETIAKDANGLILSCQSGRWERVGVSKVTTGYSVTRWGQISGVGTTSTSLGNHRVCFLSGNYSGIPKSSPSDSNEGQCTVTSDTAQNWTINASVTYGWYVASCSASCLD